MDDFGMVLRAAEPITLGAAYFMVLGPLLIYPFARWRAHREQVADNHLGVKFALGYFALLAFQIVLLGLTIVLFAMLSKAASDDRSVMYRAGFGMLVPGLIILSAHAAMLKRTNQEQFPSVLRLCLGYNLLLTGLLGLTAFVLTCEALFAKSSSGDFGRFAGAALVVYGAAWCVSGMLFSRIVLDPHAPDPAQAAVATPAPIQPSGPTLPPLGGGSFPPIDPKG